MSSQHFVKEGQEPALLILEEVPYSLAAPLLEWSPLIMTTREALKHVLSWGIKPDVVIATNVEADLQQLLNELQPVSVRIQSTSSTIEEVCLYLQQLHQHFLHILLEDIEAFLPTLNKMATEMRLTVFEEHIRWNPVRGKPFEKWVAAGTAFFIRSTVQGQFLEMIGLRETEGAYVAEKEGIVRVFSPSPFWLGESL